MVKRIWRAANARSEGSLTSVRDSQFGQEKRPEIRSSTLLEIMHVSNGGDGGDGGDGLPGEPWPVPPEPPSPDGGPR